MVKKVKEVWAASDESWFASKELAQVHEGRTALAEALRYVSSWQCSTLAALFKSEPGWSEEKANHWAFKIVKRLRDEGLHIVQIPDDQPET